MATLLSVRSVANWGAYVRDFLDGRHRDLTAYREPPTDRTTCLNGIRFLLRTQQIEDVLG